MKYAKSILPLLLVLAMLVGLCPTVLAAGLPFADVADDSWYHDSVEYVWENGLMSGTSPTPFGPDTAMTRAMLVTVLWRYSGSPKGYEKGFSDVAPGLWYSDAIAWAAAHRPAKHAFSGVGRMCHLLIAVWTHEYLFFIHQVII